MQLKEATTNGRKQNPFNALLIRDLLELVCLEVELLQA